MRLGFRNADFSGVLIGRGLSIGGKVDLLASVPVISKGPASSFCCAGGVCLITGFFESRGGRLFGLAGFGGEIGSIEGGWMFACITSASCFSTSLTGGGALIDSSLLFGFIEILASRLALTVSSTMLIKFGWEWTGLTGLGDTIRRCGFILVGVLVLPDVERLLWAEVGVRLGLDAGGADVTLVSELLRDRDVTSVGRGRCGWEELRRRVTTLGGRKLSSGADNSRP